MAPTKKVKLSSEDADRVGAERLIGGRVARLREIRGYPQQKDLLDSWEDLTKKPAPSKTWLSLVETNQLRLSDKKRPELVEALRLTDEDADLLNETDESVPESLVHYVAWQAVRLEMGDRLNYRRKGDEVRRGRRILSALREVLEGDPDIQKVVAGRPLQLEVFRKDLTPEERWMLVIEAAYMDPFAPHEPFDSKWADDRTADLEHIGAMLDLDAPTDVFKQIEKTREPGLGAWLMDRELKNAQLAAADVTDAYGHRALMSGRALVGSLGWDFACGKYLARLQEPEPRDGDESSTKTGAYFEWRGLLGDPVPDVLLAGSLIGASVTKAFLDALSDGRLARMSRRADAAAELSEDPSLTRVDIATFLRDMGSNVARLEVSKLSTLCQVRKQVPEMFPLSGETPSNLQVKAQFDLLIRTLDKAEEQLKDFDREESPARKSLRTLSADVKVRRKQLP